MPYLCRMCVVLLLVKSPQFPRQNAEIPSSRAQNVKLKKTDMHMIRSDGKRCHHITPVGMGQVASQKEGII